jgi:putative acetyltransferase
MQAIYRATTEGDYAGARILFREYAESIGIDLGFQHFEEELGALQQMYGPPCGAIFLAGDGAEPFGCIGIRKISASAAEIKRMYVRPAEQRRGAGNLLLGKALEIAREYNYSIVRLDSLSHLKAAIHLYKKAGFYEIPAYYDNPLPSAVYFEKKL